LGEQNLFLESPPSGTLPILGLVRPLGEVAVHEEGYRSQGLKIERLAIPTVFWRKNKIGLFPLSDIVEEFELCYECDVDVLSHKDSTPCIAEIPRIGLLYRDPVVNKNTRKIGPLEPDSEFGRLYLPSCLDKPLVSFLGFHTVEWFIDEHTGNAPTHIKTAFTAYGEGAAILAQNLLSQRRYFVELTGDYIRELVGLSNALMAEVIVLEESVTQSAVPNPMKYASEMLDSTSLNMLQTTSVQGCLHFTGRFVARRLEWPEVWRDVVGPTPEYQPL
jgi:hypothetical protein